MDDFSDFSIYDWMNNAPRGTASNGSNTPKYRGRGRGDGSSTPRGGTPRGGTPRGGTPRGGTPRGGIPRGGTPRGGFATSSRGFDSPRGRGRSRYNTLSEMEDPDPGMGRGRGSPVGRGRGRGGKNLASKLKAGVPLSKLLYEDRPLLKPIKFVRSVYTATLFEEEEDILQPLAEDTTNDEASHVPTAAQINRVFGTAEVDAPEEQLEEIDFSDIGKLQAEVDAAAAKLAESKTETALDVAVVGEKFTGFYIDTNPAPVKEGTHTRDIRDILGDDDDDDDDEVIVYVAPHPRAGPVTPPLTPAAAEFIPTTSILTGLVPQLSVAEAPAPPSLSDTIIDATHAAAPEHSHAKDFGGSAEEHPVTIAPHVLESVPVVESVEEAPVPSVEALSSAETAIEPQQPALEAEQTADATASEFAPRLPVEPAQPSDSSAEAGLSSQPPPAEKFTFSFKATTQKKTYTRRPHPARTPRSLLKQGARTCRKPPRGFSSFGASLAEAQLHREDPRAAERRIGDSDLEWGDDASDDGVEELENGVGDMAVDDELDINAMKSFVKSMGAEGSRMVTMDDIADAQHMQEEDEEGEEGEGEGSTAGSSEEDSELEAAVRMEEEFMVAESAEIAVDDVNEDGEEDEDGDEDSDDDEFDSPRRGFQARLQRIREHAAKGKGKAKAVQPPDSDEDKDEDDVEMTLERSWADEDEDFIAHIQDLVDEGQEILSRKDHKLQNELFRLIRDGEIDYDEYEELMGRPARRNKDKYKDLPDELQAQWEADRAKKAENKRKRAQTRLEAEADPLTKKKGGKKGMKAMLAAARYEGEEELPNRIVDLATLEKQIRRFLANIGGPRTMSTPPADKEARKQIHELANAFSLKSQSKGKGNTRYTVLTKTTKSGTNVNEWKIRRILNVSGYWDTTGSARGGNGKGVSLAKHHEGEEVGKAAPKINASNIGFQMLASMGWAEGDRIGLSGGLEAPLTAKMKKTKLGLGAMPIF
ncbi:uncharacterized protein PHACADRAFT_258843 [Phanerochaete carnosa HHB-10118-sp]|uniref:Protein SQS1 n=1 Tax=Phanerochaete carnosa (strain HHB-10118-sp) TaxID=650164 RepID=K5W6J4_PHACS|nr:uncharacterized protein PHACADRAFT_258843 [Phanerochaete carnosa HHB-10118-sp]EKM54770.1 hypothetical protein PHACADRAFT_258843 [Phanerochaete carnosa HHB-10118-sp]